MADTTAKSPLNLTHKLPFEGELFASPSKKHNETILLVPFFGAKKNSLKRHAEFLTQIGYDVATFDLERESRTLQKPLVSSTFLVGLKHIWADQIESMLNSLPGNKIVFAFSNPSASAIEAIVRRNSYDVSALICDSGPSADLYSSMMNYFTFEEPIKFLPLKILASVGISLYWSPSFNSAINEDLNRLPPNFPILSIRGWKDKIIPVSLIDKVFDLNPNLNWQKLSLPGAAHLNGLRDFPEEYKPAIEKFLSRITFKKTFV